MKLLNLITLGCSKNTVDSEHLAAQLAEAGYVITFDSDGGTDVLPIVQDYGTPITAPEDPTKTGYTFAGWKYADGSTASFPITLGEDAVYVYATWNAKSYYIEFYAPTESDCW